ncbi:protein CFAP276-like [Daktulosphaira vitifoliae]|uniref:protein CFAP276-like n=1 Tax=Daktulosphaira vitifoliae TaxID=58002 RepID=UPI0021AAC5E4|nr:protein CFAP276-like [Daktulosphaira vitifoliae]
MDQVSNGHLSQLSSISNESISCLHKKATISSEHRSVRWRPDVKTVTDSLDMTLMALYNHSSMTFPQTNEVYLQEKTFTLSLQKQQKNNQKFEKLFRNHPLKKGGLIGVRKDANSIKLGQGGSHISQTNHGYSRKEDGTFYNY